MCAFHLAHVNLSFLSRVVRPLARAFCGKLGTVRVCASVPHFPTHACQIPPLQRQRPRPARPCHAWYRCCGPGTRASSGACWGGTSVECRRSGTSLASCPSFLECRPLKACTPLELHDRLLVDGLIIIWCAVVRVLDGRYCAVLSVALAGRSYTSMKMYRQIGVLGALLARRSWGDLQAAQVRVHALMMCTGSSMHPRTRSTLLCSWCIHAPGLNYPRICGALYMLHARPLTVVRWCSHGWPSQPRYPPHWWCTPRESWPCASGAT